MQSDLVVEAKAEISSFPPKARHHNEKYCTTNGYEETRAEVSKSCRTPSSANSENVVKREKTYSPPLKKSGFNGSPLKEVKATEKEIPFDQAEDDAANRKPYVDSKDRDEGTFQSRRNEVTDSGIYDLVENGGRFIVPPPKYSNLCSIALDNNGAPLPIALDTVQKHLNVSSRGSLTPHRASEGAKAMTPSSIHQGENTNKEIGNEVGTMTRVDEHSHIVTHELGTKDANFIYKLPEEKRLIDKTERDRGENGERISNKNIIMRRRSRQRRKQQILLENSCTDDDMSLVNYGTCTAATLHSSGLQERAHQAWKSRQRKNSTMRSKNENKSQPAKASNVSFGVSDTIHHFDSGVPKCHKYRNEKEEDMSLDRSLNSEYTKTLESEVEDMIKDILFIGNPQRSKPGRRKYRYKSDVERKLLKDRMSKAAMNTGTKTVESGGLGILHVTNVGKIEDEPSQITALTLDKIDQKYEYTNDSRVSRNAKKNVSRSKYREQNFGHDGGSLASSESGGSSVGSNTLDTVQSEKGAIEDPLNTVLGFVEGGLSVMTTALGYALGDDMATETREDTARDSQKATSDYDILESCGIRIRDEKTEADGQILTETNPFSKYVWMDGSGNLGPTASKSPPLRSKKAERKSDFFKEQHNKSSIIYNTNKPDGQTLNLEDSPEIIRLAKYAARSIHKLQGIEYDESVPIDMYKEVKKCHVTLELPLGSKFFTVKESPMMKIK